VAEDAASTGSVRLALTDADVARDRPAAECAAWPHRFRAGLLARVHGNTLEVTLEVTNADGAPFTFTAALHPYFAVRDAFACTVVGLHGLRYRDALRDGAIVDETGDALAITGPLDRVYYAAPDRLELREPHRTLRIEKSGFADAVVWNPGAAGTSSRRDFVPGDEQRMLCVEAGAIGAPVTLAPGARWSGTQRMTAIATAGR
jgi:glucose-6-phosphate 1-epimerase